MTFASAPVESFEGRWYVIQCWAGKEKELIRRLTDRCIHYFIPLIKEHRKTGLVWLPRFSGYGFYCGDDTDRYRVMETDLCVGQKVIPVLSCVRQETLRNQLIDLAKAPTVVTKPLTFGTPVRVTGGVWEGHEGFVDSDGKAYVWLRLDVLGIGTPVQVERQFVEVLAA